MATITHIDAEEVLDSRGKPTIRVTVAAGDCTGSFSVPSGASTGSKEALVLRDEDGGMDAAIASVRDSIAPAVLGMDAAAQGELDARMLELDGTELKSSLGGNAMLGVGCAAARAAARAAGIELFEHLRSLSDISPSRPVPLLYMNYINGGKHADSPLAFQEHIIVPQTDDLREALTIAAEFGAALEWLIGEKYGAAAAQSMGDEGGYVLPESDPRAPFELMRAALEGSGHVSRAKIAIDAAASSFYENGSYRVGGESMTAAELADLYRELIAAYPFVSIEDPFEEAALKDFALLQSATEARIVGDDLTVTSARRIEEAAAAGAIKAVIVKPNQAGTLTETLEAMQAARARGVECIVSHRSGETMDDFVADLAFAFGAFGLKAGSLRKPERAVKYERLRTIAHSL